MDEASFLAQVIDRPEDDAPRLMFADWLEERGDPRGEFIRVQCERALLRPPTKRWRALVQREQELLAAHGEAWLAEFDALGVVGRFRRGFVDSVEAPADLFLSRAAKLFALAPIRRAIILGDVARGRRKWRQLECLARLDDLALHGNHGGAAFVRMLADLTHLAGLRGLAIENDMLDTATVRTLAHLTNLPRLERLTLTNNALYDEGAQALANARNLAGLRRLSLQGNYLITAIGVGALATSSFLARLEALNLASTRAGNGAAAYLAFSPNLEHLRELNLSRALEGGPAGVLPLADSIHLPRLETLSLGDNSLGDEGLNALSQSRRLESLRQLDLSCNGVTSAGVAALANWPRLAQLEVLDLSGNRIDAAGVELLAGSRFLTNDCLVLLAGNPLGERRRRRSAAQDESRFDLRRRRNAADELC